MYPALLSQATRRTTAADNRGASTWWASLTREQKDLLAMLPLYKIKAAAARAIGKTPKWLGSQEMNHPRFRGGGEGRSVAGVGTPSKWPGRSQWT